MWVWIITDNKAKKVVCLTQKKKVKDLQKPLLKLTFVNIKGYPAGLEMEENEHNDWQHWCCENQS